MAICKILHIKDSGDSFHGRRLKNSIEYIQNPDKTQNGRLVAAKNCQVEYAFEQMVTTKEYFQKMDGRQGYHFIISFEEHVVTPDQVMELAEAFVDEYLKGGYEVIYATHDNTEHIHAHIIFNSVNSITGLKYHYKKGDWEAQIQPIVNRLCKERGIQTLMAEMRELDEEGDYKKPEYIRRFEGADTFDQMIRRDLDSCIKKADSYEQFLELLVSRGYEIKQGKYLAIRPPGRKKFRRTHSLGEVYSEEVIRSRVLSEQEDGKESKQKVARVKGTMPTKRIYIGIQKRYLLKGYRIKMLAKRPYSKAYKYREDIRQLHQIQGRYLFLLKHEIKDLAGLLEAKESIELKVKLVDDEHHKMNRERKKLKEYFDVLEELHTLEAAEHTYQAGDAVFEEEHQKYEQDIKKIEEAGYTVEQLTALKESYQDQGSSYYAVKRELRKEEKIADQILEEIREMKNVSERLPIEPERNEKVSPRLQNGAKRK